MMKNRNIFVIGLKLIKDFYVSGELIEEHGEHMKADCDLTTVTYLSYFVILLSNNSVIYDTIFCSFF